MSSVGAGSVPNEPSNEPSIEQFGAQYRYGIVFLLVFTEAVVLILTPDGQASRAVAFALISAALITAISTSRVPGAIRHRRFAIGTGLAVLVTIGIATGLIGRNGSLILAALMALAVPLSLSRGLLRLVRERGPTFQAVAGALAVYLLVGLGFAAAIGFAGAVGSGNFYANGSGSSTSQNVYYSFTVLTTTGFGDFTAAHRFGRALAVSEMLIGQIYLVTVIGILIGRRSTAGPPGA